MKCPLLLFYNFFEALTTFSGSLSSMRRLIVAEAHPPGPYQEVLASSLAAVKDNSGQVFCYVQISIA